VSPLLDDLAVPLDDKEADRRKFLSLLGAGALGVAALGTVITAVKYFEPNVFFEADTRFAIGRPADIAIGTVLVLTAQKVYVVRTEKGFYALSSVCTHLGCMTRYDPAESRIACPCHGSRFALTGKVTGGPAPRPLPRVSLTLEKGLLVVDSRRRVADDFLLEVPA
jgi:cytochrome b6-f complex iron-sulfur subunit